MGGTKSGRITKVPGKFLMEKTPEDKAVKKRRRKKVSLHKNLLCIVITLKKVMQHNF